MKSETERDLNPVTALRERWGMTRPEFAALLGCSYMSLFNTERGLVSRVPRRMSEALANIGADAEALESEYGTWIETRARDMREKLAAGAGV